MRLAKNNMSIGWLLIVPILLMLLGCNEGGSNTVMPSNLKAITAFSFPSANGPVNGTITGQNIALATPFVAYYPSGCILNNTAAVITGNCTCIKDTDTGNIWTTAGNIDDIWENWCNHTPATPGYDPNCPTTSNKLDTWNNNAQCGLTGGWRLPTAPTPSDPNPSSTAPLSGTNPGGDWSDLYNIAISGSAPPGTAYTSGGDLSVWMNNNGFMNISNSKNCSRSPFVCPSYYWSNGLTFNIFGWEVFMNNGGIAEEIVNTVTGVLLVHSGQ